VDLGKPQVKHRVLSLEPKINKYNVMAANQSSQPFENPPKLIRKFNFYSDMGIARGEAMKAMRPLLSLVIAMSLAPIAVAQAPATDAQVVTLEFSGDSLKEPLSKAFPGLDDPQSYDLDNPDILTKDGESLATLYTTVEPLCHVATVSSSQTIAQRCQTQTSKQVADWKRFFTELGKLLQPKTSSSITKEQWTAFETKWTTALAPNDSKFYLIDSGKTFHPQMVGSLVQVVRAAAREAAGEVVKPGSFAPALPVSFNPPCKFPATATGAKVTKLCSKSLPITPFSATIEGDTLVLKRIEWKATQAFVSLTKKTDEAVVDAQKEAPRRVLINLLETEKSCIFEGRTVAHGQTRTRFSASRAPVGQRCEKLVRRCENGVMSGDDAFRFLTCSDTQACDFDKKKVKDKGTTDAYKLNVVDSSTGRTCSEPTNIMRRTCTNGQLSGPNEFRFSTCTARPMPGCNVIDRTKPGGYRTIPHGDTGEVFTSATAPSGSSCASVKKTAQCLNGRMFVDGVATAVFTPFFTDCTDRAPGGPGGNVNPGVECPPKEHLVELPDGSIEVEMRPDEKCNGQQGTAEICNNGIDDDGDLAVDCDDGDCRDKVECIDDEPHPDECGGTDAERCELVNKQIASFQKEWRNKKATMPFTQFVKELLAACAESTKSWKECCSTATMPARGEVACSQLPTETEPAG
jgi:hypothetical protein